MSSPMNKSNQIISIKEARKALGKDYKDFPDDLIEQMILELGFIAEIVIKHQRKEVVPKYTVDSSNNKDKGE